MDGVASRGPDRGMAVIEESRNVLRLVVAGEHQLDAMSRTKPPRIVDERDPILSLFTDRHRLGIATDPKA